MYIKRDLNRDINRHLIRRYILIKTSFFLTLNITIIKKKKLANKYT